VIAAEVRTRHCRIPPATPWEDALAPVPNLDFITLEITTDEGVTGLGLTYAVGPGGSAIKALLDDELLPLVKGQDVSAFDALWHRLRKHLRRAGTAGLTTMALAAVDVAVWDALAKSQGVPLYKLLGGDRVAIEVYASGIDLAMSPDELAALVQGYVDDGYQTVKVKVGRPTLGEDVARLAAARQVMGDGRELLLDANQGWTVDEAVRRLAAFERFRPGWIEEPLVAEDVAGHARLRQATSTPIAMGESLSNKEQFAAYLRADAVDVLQPDIARVGGFTEWRKIAALAEANGLTVAPHYLMELSVHALCGVANGAVLENVTGGGLFDLGLLASGLSISDGVAAPPDRPGHGIVLDRAVLDFEVPR
jgi:L-alanine-DL-glutamate epimerase-like enolase superfamily enzyme